MTTTETTAMHPALAAVSVAQTAVNIESLMQCSFWCYIVVAVVVVLVVVAKINKLSPLQNPPAWRHFFLNAGVTETLTQTSPGSHPRGVHLKLDFAFFF